MGRVTHQNSRLDVLSPKNTVLMIAVEFHVIRKFSLPTRQISLYCSILSIVRKNSWRHSKSTPPS